MNKTPCELCGTLSQKMPRCGKRRYRHKCRHGRWCMRGNRLNGSHANYNLACRDCLVERGELAAKVGDEGTSVASGHR